MISRPAPVFPFLVWSILMSRLIFPSLFGKQVLGPPQSEYKPHLIFLVLV